MEWLIQGLIGLTAGLLGGLLGIGGSIIIIPGMIFYFSYTAQGYSGQAQHELQAAAMICNLFIAAPAAAAHRRANAIMKPVVVRLIPAALAGIFLGVAASNSSTFARENGRYLAMILSGFMAYVVVYNLVRLSDTGRLSKHFDPAERISMWKIFLVGLPMGLTAGLLGVGGGALCVPAQQIFLRIPLRRAIANSATTIAFTAIFGAIYKNATLSLHGVSVGSALHLALLLSPPAALGSYIGGRLTHMLPRKVLRIAFIVLMTVVSIQTFRKSREAGERKSEIRISKSEMHPPLSCAWRRHPLQVKR
jgi:uncharacterized membrane protein YfcA